MVLAYSLNDPLAQSVEHLTFNQGVPRSSRGWITKIAPVAQSVEQRTENPRVGGSIPPGGTKLAFNLS
ncbi:MAG: hypothetical protein FD182_1274 [Fusobacteria bacterium]|jgi:hypothetical protein|nr:MAG: hypothetical protein FD182_1274 [Fusobacteriota bacterium]